MNIPFVVETVLHDGLLKYKFKNSKIRSITTKPGKSKGAIFAYRSKKSMIGGRGVVLTSEEAIHENQDTFTHWTPNVYRYGTGSFTVELKYFRSMPWYKAIFLSNFFNFTLVLSTYFMVK